MVERIAITCFPLFANQRRYQQQQGALGLMEICYQTIDDAVAVSWGNHELRFAVEIIGILVLHPAKNICIGIGVGQRGVEDVRIPLVDVHALQLWVGLQLDTEPVEGFECAHRGGAHRDERFAMVGDDTTQVVSGDVYRLNVHFVLADGVCAYGLKCTCPYMKSDVFCFDAFVFQSLEDFGREMQACCGGGYRAFVVSVNGLVADGVAFLGLAVEVGRQGDDSGGVNDLGETQSTCPIEIDNPGVAYGFAAGGLN